MGSVWERAVFMSLCEPHVEHGLSVWHTTMELSESHNEAWLAEYVAAKAKWKPGLEMYGFQHRRILRIEEEEGIFDPSSVYLFLLPKEWGYPVIHFWMGEKSSQPERQMIMKLVVDLDSKAFGRKSVTFREIQGFESPLFLSYFEHICYITGPRDVATEDRKLFKVSNAGVSVKVEQVNGNRCDPDYCYLLLLRNHLHIYTESASQPNKLRGLKASSWLQNQVLQFPIMVHNSEKDGETSLIWSKPETDNMGHESHKKPAIRLYRSKDAVGRTMLTEITTRPFTPELFTPTESILVDTGILNGIFLVDGLEVEAKELQASWRKGMEYVRRSNYPAETQITRLSNTQNVAVFKSIFGFESNENGTNKQITMADWVPQYKDLEDLEIWRVENFYLIPVDKVDYGTFYTEDCYIVLLRQQKATRESGLLYLWQGRQSSKEQRRQAVELLGKINIKELEGTAIQMRIEEDREPYHFLRIFCPRMVVLMGGQVSGRRATNARKTYDTDGIRMFRLSQARVVQVPERETQLEKNNGYVIETPSRTFIWLGPGVDETEKSLAKEFARLVLPLKNPVMVEEGQEPLELWEYIGANKAKKGKKKQIQEEWEPKTISLWKYSGHWFHQLLPITQAAFQEDAVLLMDTPSSIYLWFGALIDKEMFKKTTDIVQFYLERTPFGKSVEESNFVAFKQGCEPAPFLSLVPGWSFDYWKKQRKPEELAEKIQRSNQKAEDGMVAEAVGLETHSLETLTLTTDLLPPGIDPAKRELYLSEAEFEKLFGMKRAIFQEFPPWKKVALKKRIGLF